MDYGRYIVQRHHPIEGEITGTEIPTNEELVKSAKKENLRKSLEKYEQFITESAKKEFPFSPEVARKEVQDIPKKESRPPQINELKEELVKLSQDFAGCKQVVNESINEVKGIMEKLREKIPEITKKGKEPELAGSDDSFVKIKHEEHEPRDVILAPEDIIEPQAVVKEETAIFNLVVEEREDEKEEEKREIMEKDTELMAEQPEAWVDPSLLKTDEFILEKFKKIGQAKDLLRSLNL